MDSSGIGKNCSLSQLGRILAFFQVVRKVALIGRVLFKSYVKHISAKWNEKGYEPWRFENLFKDNSFGGTIGGDEQIFMDIRYPSPCQPWHRFPEHCICVDVAHLLTSEVLIEIRSQSEIS